MEQLCYWIWGFSRFSDSVHVRGKQVFLVEKSPQKSLRPRAGETSYLAFWQFVTSNIPSACAWNEFWKTLKIQFCSNSVRVERVFMLSDFSSSCAFRPRGTSALFMRKISAKVYSVRVRVEQVFVLCSFCVFVCFPFISCIYFPLLLTCPMTCPIFQFNTFACDVSPLLYPANAAAAILYSMDW